VWTETAILSAIDAGGADRDAALAGFFSNANIQGQALFNRMKSTILALSTGEDGPRRHYESMLADLCISAWHHKSDAGERMLSDQELRTVLVYCSVTMRTRALWQVSRWEDLAEELTLLRTVWPLQLAARGPAVTGRLCSIALDDETNFPALVDAILPLVSLHDGSGMSLSMITDTQSKVFELHPEHALALLSAVLPEDVAKWPYGVDAALQRLQKTSKEISKDPRVVELKRRLTRSR
jgi:hypothetical protein